jgi:oxygen-dependent protoporphyrinogen oxidase
MLAGKPEGLALCRELGLGDELVPTSLPRTVWVRRRGRLYPLPEGAAFGVPTRLRPLLASGLFSWPGKLRVALEPLMPARRGQSDEPLADFVRRRLGGEALERIGQPLLAGIHSGDARRLSAAATFPRLVEMERRHGSLVRGLRAAARDAPVSAFVSLRKGLGSLVEALVRALPAASLRGGAPVSGVRRDEGGYEVAAEDGGQVRCRAVVVAVPAPRAARLLEGTAPAAAQALDGIRFASTATVLLGYRRADVRHPLDGHGFVSMAGEGRLRACTFLSTKLPERAPAGHVLLRAFFGGAGDPDALALDDAALVAQAVAELGDLLGLAGTPAITRVYRWPEGIPQMEVGHQDRVGRLEAAVSTAPGLFVTGGGLRGAGIPDTVADARRVAGAAVTFARTT